jgi:hypothetical protein
MSTRSVVPLLPPSPRDQWLNELEQELRGFLKYLRTRPRQQGPRARAKAWRAVAKLLMLRELGANEFGASYRDVLWNAVEGFAEGRVTGSRLRAILRRVDLLASERPLRRQTDERAY